MEPRWCDCPFPGWLADPDCVWFRRTDRAIDCVVLYGDFGWPDYDRGLVRRGDIRFWIDERALEQWDAAKRRTPGGQRRFTELAISTTLMLGMVFRFPLRQTEGFVRSLVDFMGCDLPVPDHTTLARRRRTVDVVVETSTSKRARRASQA